MMMWTTTSLPAVAFDDIHDFCCDISRWYDIWASKNLILYMMPSSSYKLCLYQIWYNIWYHEICPVEWYPKLYHNMCIYCLKIEITNNAAEVFIVWGWYQFKYIMLCETNRLFFSHDTSLWLLKIIKNNGLSCQYKKGLKKNKKITKTTIIII